MLTLLAVILAILIFLVAMPFFFWIMAEAVYKAFLRPSIRARRIQKIRNHRLMFEAAARDHTDLE
jgi:hypothetical protein